MILFRLSTYINFFNKKLFKIWALNKSYNQFITDTKKEFITI